MAKVETLGEFLGLQPEQPVEEVPRPSLFDTLTIKDFCKGVLASREYRQSILDRITLGSLPPAVECRMYDYAYGKPPERVEHTGADGEPIKTITEVRRVVVRAPVQQEETEPQVAVVH